MSEQDTQSKKRKVSCITPYMGDQTVSELKIEAHLRIHILHLLLGNFESNGEDELVQ